VTTANVHVVPNGDKVDFELHGTDGRIREKDSYGHDPRDPRDLPG
jgi:hypothetical protein